jgi:hypothetical protein
LLGGLLKALLDGLSVHWAVLVSFIHPGFLESIHMSHVVTIKTEVRDPLALRVACSRMNLPAPVYGSAQLFSSEFTGWQVNLPQWRYPLICQTDLGQIQFDNFEGRWGDQSQLDHFLQAYAVEKAILEARKQGHSVSEQSLADGTICVRIAVAG